MRPASYAAVLVVLFVSPLAAAQETQTFDESYLFDLTSVTTPTSHTNSGTNCLIIGGPLEIQEGSAVATWDAQSPLTERLEITLVHFADDGVTHTSVAGTSPLAYPIADLTLDTDGSIWIVVQLAGTGVAFEQAIDLDLSLSYTKGDVVVRTAGCAASSG